MAGVAAAGRDAFASELVYEAPPECPSRDEVVARLRAEREPSRPARVTVRRREPKGFVADAIVGSGEDSTSRRIEGETCEGVVEAVRLVLSLDQPSEHESAPAVPQPPPPALAPAAVIEPSDSPTQAKPEGRSAVEIALGQELGLRSMASKTMAGAAVFVELGLPTVGPTWFRPSTRVSAGTWGSGLFFDDFGATTTNLLAAVLDVCPLGAAMVSETHLDIVLAACGRIDVGEAKRGRATFWSDAGGLARGEVQIGRKRHVRGLLTVSGGILWRLAEDVATIASAPTSSPLSANMWTFSVGGGVLFR